MRKEMNNMEDVIDYDTFIRTAANSEVSVNGVYGCVEECDMKLRELIHEDEYYELAGMRNVIGRVAHGIRVLCRKYRR